MSEARDTHDQPGSVPDPKTSGPDFLWRRRPDADRSRGVLTVAYGKPEYLELAEYLGRSLRMHDPGLSLAVVTDAAHPNLAEVFDYGVALHPEWGANVEQKMFLDRYTPFERTLFVDSDCLAVRGLGEVWQLFEGRSFAVVGEDRDSGYQEYWKIDFAEFTRRHGLRSMPDFNGGVYYFGRDEGARAVFESARQIMKEYGQYGFAPFRGVAADEPVFALAQARLGIAAVRDGGRVMGTPAGIRGRLTVDVLRGRSRIPVRGRVISPAIVHFPGGWRGEPVYWRERKKLEWMNRGGVAATAMARALNAAFFVPHAAYVLSIRGAKRVLKLGRRPTYPSPMW